MDPDTARQLNETLKSIDAVLKSIPDKVSAVAQWLRIGKEEVNKTAEASRKAADAAEKHAVSQRKVTDEVKKTGDAATATGVKITNMSAGADGSLGKLGISLDGLSSSAKNLESELGKLVQAAGLQGLDRKVALAATSFSVLGTSVLNLGNNLYGLGDNLEVVGDRTSKLASEDLSNLRKSLDSLGNIPGLGGVVGGLQKTLGVFEKFAGAVSGMRRMENALIGMRAQFGGFSREGSRLDFIENLPRELSRFNAAIEGTATSMNLGVGEVEKYAFELQKIPGAFDSIVRAGDGTGRSVRLLELGMRVARGTTGDFKDVLGAMDLEFRQFGQASANSLDYLSRMSEMANAVGVSFKDFRESVDNIVKGFSSLGNTSQSATELVGGLSRALMNTGIGIEPAKRIIEGITGSMQQMGIAQKAFLSQQTGGAGGLQGAFQIDQMIAQGDVRGVYERMEQALRQQFGGRIVTLDEGAQDANAASQLTKQLAFLRQGPFGQMVKSDADAYKLLEAFRSGTGPDSEMLSRGQAAIGNALEADRATQDKQRDSLVTVANSTKALFRESQIHTALLARNIVGGGNVGTVIQRAEQAAKARGIAAGSPDEDTFQYKGSARAVLGRLAGLGSDVLGTTPAGVPAGPGTEGIAGAMGRRALGQAREGLEGIRSVVARGNAGRAPGPVGQATGIVMPGVLPDAAGESRTPPVVKLDSDTLRIILETTAGDKLFSGPAKMSSASSRATGGKAP